MQQTTVLHWSNLNMHNSDIKNQFKKKQQNLYQNEHQKHTEFVIKWI